MIVKQEALTKKVDKAQNIHTETIKISNRIEQLKKLPVKLNIELNKEQLQLFYDIENMIDTVKNYMDKYNNLLASNEIQITKYDETLDKIFDFCSLLNVNITCIEGLLCKKHMVDNSTNHSLDAQDKQSTKKKLNNI